MNGTQGKPESTSFRKTLDLQFINPQTRSFLQILRNLLCYPPSSCPHAKKANALRDYNGHQAIGCDQRRLQGSVRNPPRRMAAFGLSSHLLSRKHQSQADLEAANDTIGTRSNESAICLQAQFTQIWIGTYLCPSSWISIPNRCRYAL